MPPKMKMRVAKSELSRRIRIVYLIGKEGDCSQSNTLQIRSMSIGILYFNILELNYVPVAVYIADRFHRERN